MSTRTSLSSISIQRPVLATVMSIAIVIFGVIGFTQLGVREYPSVDPPVISVSTAYRGANADVIDAQITEPLETEINSIDGIRTLTSVSREGRSTITVEFEIGADLERAANDVRDRVSRAQRRLPIDAEPPTVSKADADAQPIVFLSISSSTRGLLELSRLADDLFKDRLQTIPGVASVGIWGERRYAMRLALDPQRLAAHRLTPLDVQQALARSNVELPSGRIEGEAVELSVRTMGRLLTVEDFEALILKEEGGRTVRLRDVGQVRLGAENERSVLKRDGTPMVGVVLSPLPGANYIAIADEFYRRLEAIRAELPEDVELGIGFDTTRSIRESIREVQQSIFLALGLVVLVIFLFLRDWRTTVIPALAIPVSLVGTFFLMYLLGFSINVLTLLAMVLAIGIVVDDAIVVLENIYAKIEGGMEPVQAGIVGTREIFFAVVATTLSLICVFLPILFLGGLVGELFKEFGLVLAGSVAISAFVALTLTPMLSTRLLRPHARRSWLYERTEPFFVRLSATYRSTLERFVARRWLAFPTLGAAALAMLLLFGALPSELAPMEDRSRLRLFASAPEGATFEFMDHYMDRLIARLMAEVPERDALISMTSPGWGSAGSSNTGFVNLILVGPEARARAQDEVAHHVTALVREMPEARVNVSQEQTIQVGRGGGLPVQYVLQAPDIERLREVLPAFLERAQAEAAFAFVDANLRFNKPELQVRIDRNRAEAVGVSALDVAQTLQLALAEQQLGYFTREGKQYPIIGSVAREARSETLDLQSLFVRSRAGEPLLLSNFVEVREQSAPPQLYRFNRFVSATVSAQLAPGHTIAEGIAAMDRVAAEVLDPSFSTSLAGPSRDYVESSGGILFVFVLALVLVYLVLAAQFESFRDPFTILLTVPLALTGALFALWYFSQTLNIFSQIGMVMLIGLVTKNGILIVEFANQRRAAGRDLREAVLEASVARLRPILMTSTSTALGILPIALALGAGAESRQPMGIAVIGGLLIGTVLTLYVIPAVYTYLAGREAPPALAAGNGRAEEEEAAPPEPAVTA